VARDLGGFAKGYAVDRAILELQKGGCVAGLVNAGGDLRVFGPLPQSVVLRQSTGRNTQVGLSNMALAVSDADFQNRPPEHQGYYSRVDNRGLRRPRYAAVMAGEAMIADALATCVLTCPASISDET